MATGCGYCGGAITGNRSICHHCQVLETEIDAAWDSTLVEAIMEQSLAESPGLMKRAQRVYEQLRCEEVANRLLGNSAVGSLDTATATFWRNRKKGAVKI